MTALGVSEPDAYGALLLPIADSGRMGTSIPSGELKAALTRR